MTTLKPGSLSSGIALLFLISLIVTLTPGTQVVGSITDLTVSFTAEHRIPANGQILLSLPKWNPLNSEKLSYITTTDAKCSGDFKCTLVSGSAIDLVQVQLTSQVAAGSTVTFVV